MLTSRMRGGTDDHQFFQPIRFQTLLAGLESF
jgi:hypothetical protein